MEVSGTLPEHVIVGSFRSLPCAYRIHVVVAAEPVLVLNGSSQSDSPLLRVAAVVNLASEDKARLGVEVGG